MIYPLLSFFLEPSLGLLVTVGGGGKEVGLGEGEGVDTLHSFSGGPHSILFPSKEEVGNFWRAAGIEPFKRLWLKFNCVSPDVFNSGMGPESKLFWRLKLERCVRFCMAAGISPVKELNERSSMLVRGEKEDGMLPEKLLC